MACGERQNRGERIRKEIGRLLKGGRGASYEEKGRGEGGLGFDHFISQVLHSYLILFYLQSHHVSFCYLNVRFSYPMC